MFLPFQGEYMQLDINPGVPLRSAPGYVLVALRGAFFQREFIQGEFIQGEFIQGAFIQSAFIRCPDDYVV